MTAISLKKVTAVVVTCVIGSYIASSSANDMNSEVKTKKVQAVDVTKGLNQFAPLVKKFDLNKDGLLSKAEVKASKLEKLISHFSEIDSNTDSGISEAEFNQFIAETK
ncbi:MAG: hypothetical protein KC484_13580 [Colwelliaceae bacterium]|nr:hypothetical protein [Colwelliaceae bacterium]